MLPLAANNARVATLALASMLAAFVPAKATAALDREPQARPAATTSTATPHRASEPHGHGLRLALPPPGSSAHRAGCLSLAAAVAGSRRWISPDPLFLESPAESLKRPLEGSNPYGYVSNNPINSTDPSGLRGQVSDGGYTEAEFRATHPNGADMTPHTAAEATFQKVMGGLMFIAAGAPVALVAPTIAVALARLGGGAAVVEQAADVGNVCVAAVDVLEDPNPQSVLGLTTAAVDAIPGVVSAVGDANTARVAAKPRINKLAPDPKAQGEHTTFKRNPQGQVSGYADWTANPRNPRGFDEKRRVDTQYAHPHSHDGVPTPHVHEKGGVTPADPKDLPK